MPLPISVIVPAHIRVNALLKTLAQIKQCIPSPDEIIVHVDGGSTEVIEAIKSFDSSIQVLFSSSLLGPGGSRNVLVEAARNVWVANFDDDSFPASTDYFSRVAEGVKRFPNLAILSASNHEEPMRCNDYWHVSMASGCGCVFNKGWFEKSGGFVPLVIAYNMEEADMGLRIHALGGQIIQDLQLRTIHDKPLPKDVLPEVNALITANTVLLPLLRYPVWLLPIAIWQMLHRLIFVLTNGWTGGSWTGLCQIWPLFCKYRCYRQSVPGFKVLSWLLLRRVPKPAVVN